ncbi:DUF2804 domain-containing protein [Romboutsia sedimentorum]|uniref:DUF2804 domain-containing protein n=1 Tax=Romboutsia sedimentorum TaxID=1368474 RepID=A0ABT7E5S8_9FIRM|nr:DUF2804 domain-containing protein [Romboutsia sedimentorum]MDK2562027.1 DUF2804 domain-containing protein [Romboutsia sedimentorum]MDK2584266.1 DUF2804 domain-containing protein [Romboutsia sedimentorum]
MKELKKKNSICSKDGKVNQECIGWGKKVFSNCSIDRGYFRKKIWNHYMWMNKDFVCALAIVKLDYAGLIFIDFYDLKENKKIHKSITIPLCNGIILHNSIGSYAHFQNKEMYLNIIRTNDKLHAMVKWGEVDIDANIFLEKESLNVLVPWSEKKFHYTSKQFPLKSSGYINVGDEDYEKFELNDSISFIDYGRGIWEREKYWYWLTCGFENEDNKVGLNLGAKWTDNTGVNENGIKIDGMLYKLYCDVDFEKIDENNWSIKSTNCEDIDLIFNISTVNDKVNNKLIIKSSLKQHIGYISGIVKADDKEIEFKEVLCWLEDHYAKW